MRWDLGIQLTKKIPQVILIQGIPRPHFGRLGGSEKSEIDVYNSKRFQGNKREYLKERSYLFLERHVWGGSEGQQHVTWVCSSSRSKRTEATAGRPGMAGHKKGPEPLGTLPFLAFTSPESGPCTPNSGPDFRVLCTCNSSNTMQCRPSLQKEDRLGHPFLFPSRLRRWVVGSLEFGSRASLMFGNHSAFAISGAYRGRLS